MRTKVIYILSLIFFSLNAKATPFSLSQENWVRNETKNFEISLLNEIVSTPHSSQLNSKNIITHTSFELSFFLTPSLTISSNFGITQQLYPATDFNYSNPEVSILNQYAQLDSHFKFYAGPYFILPINDEARRNSLLLTSGIANRILMEFAHFTAYYDLIYSHHFNHFQTKLSGESNEANALLHRLYLQNRYQNLFLNLQFGFNSHWNEENTISNEILSEQEIGISITQKASLSLAHFQGGNFLSPDGQSYQFNVFNSSESNFSIRFNLYL